MCNGLASFILDSAKRRGRPLVVERSQGVVSVTKRDRSEQCMWSDVVLPSCDDRHVSCLPRDCPDFFSPRY